MVNEQVNQNLSPADSAKLLFETIKAVCQSDGITTNVEGYNYFRLLEDLRTIDVAEKYIEVCNLKNNSNVLVVRKPVFPACPEPAANLKKYLPEGYDNFYMKDVLIKPDCLDVVQKDDTLLAAYEDWISERREWIKEVRFLQEVNMLYKTFYSILSEFKADPDGKELLFGFGMFYDRSSKDIRRPLFVKRLKIEYLNSKADALRIYDEDSELKYDSEFLGVVNNQSFTSVGDMQKYLEGVEDPDIYNDIECKNFLNSFVNNLSDTVVFCDDGQTLSTLHQYVVRYEPCIIYRKRGTGLISYLDKVIQAIEDKISVPEHITRILMSGSGSDGKKGNATLLRNDDSFEVSLAKTSGEHPEVLFTKPANKEQLEIVLDVQDREAIEVQGPPGTGKTHTIANLIGHFLSQGKTILVASEKKKALTVLKNQLDKNLQSLCVPVFEDNNKEIEVVVKEILNNYHSLVPNSLEKGIEELTDSRKSCIQQLNNLRSEIFALREKSAKSIVLDGRSSSVIEAAKEVSENKVLLKLIPDSTDSIDILPLSNREVEKLYDSYNLIDFNEEKELSYGLVDYNRFITPDAFNELVLENKENLKDIDFPYKADFKNNILYLNDKKLFVHPSKDSVRDLSDFVKGIKEYDQWELAVIDDSVISEGRRSRWLGLNYAVNSYILKYNYFIEKTFGHTFNLGKADSQELRKTLPKIRERFEAGQGFGFFYMFRNSDVKGIMEEVRIDGRALGSCDDCDCLLSLLYFQEEEQALKIKWDQIFSGTDMCQFENISKNKERFIGNVSERIRTCLNWRNEKYDKFLTLANKAGFNSTFLNSFSALGSSPSDYIREIIDVMPTYIKVVEQFLLKKQFNDTVNGLSQVFHQSGLNNSVLTQQLLQMVNTCDVEGYRTAYEKYKKVYDKYFVFNERKRCLGILDQYAPEWADSIRLKKSSFSFQDGIFPDFALAWRVMRLNFILNKIFAESLSAKEEKTEVLSKELLNITGELVKKKAWYSLIMRVGQSGDVLTSLQDWKLFNDRIGRGKGKHANLYRSKANEFLRKGQQAIPVWITTVNRAIDMFDPARVKFDIAIIDEASQSSLEALAVSFLAEKIIVVGDDKQVSPMLVGKEIDSRHSILAKYLKGVISGYELFDGRTSYYDLVGRVYPVRMLKEHFRCVPEIIEYSNRQYYNGMINPLRNSNSSSLKPAVIPLRVNGQRSAKLKKINEIEAFYVVSLIKACMDLPEYKGKTFGVISLKGKEQADYITSLLPELIDNMATIESRELICGDSASFQGDERDVIFITMVDDEATVRNISVGTSDYEKRYNVALSRAKDQVWIIHSFDYAGGKLKQDSLQFRLLDYAYNYENYLNQRKQIAIKSQSPFEEEVANRLVSKGYRIEQQYPAGSYFIDIVVFDNDSKIAIECDGERYHSQPEKIKEDMERQCILQRIGWKFVRIRGGVFYRDKDGTMEWVFAKLRENGVQPSIIGVDGTISGSIVDTELLNNVKRTAERYLKEMPKKYGTIDFGSLFASIEVNRGNLRAAEDEEDSPATGNYGENRLEAISNESDTGSNSTNKGEEEEQGPTEKPDEADRETTNKVGSIGQKTAVDNNGNEKQSGVNQGGTAGYDNGNRGSTGTKQRKNSYQRGPLNPLAFYDPPEDFYERGLLFENGKVYDTGLEIKKDMEKAFEHYIHAAKRGHAKAQNKVGDMYYYGQGVKQDYNEALKWYRKAAAQGSVDGYNNFCNSLKFQSLTLFDGLQKINSINIDEQSLFDNAQNTKDTSNDDN